jgi:hypothetical protein
MIERLTIYVMSKRAGCVRQQEKVVVSDYQMRWLNVSSNFCLTHDQITHCHDRDWKKTPLVPPTVGSENMATLLGGLFALEGAAVGYE